ncbi:MAG: hypothetical protein CMK09_08375 [Ponticaulis sp.]|nr:hypothetical protein [Ponticaulis sp.]|tara:strand:- start:12325 stop:12975 length:651 start_codon:yes stop_codon:yes gene_type:complete
MKIYNVKNIPSAAVSFAAILSIAACGGPAPERVREVYYDFSSQVSHRNGPEAGKVVNEATLRHYALLKVIALNGGRGMNSIGIYDELSVYFLRARYDIPALEKFTGRDILSILVQAGLVGEDDFETFELEDLRYTNNQARADLFKNGADTELDVWFEREDGRWRIDGKRFREIRNEMLERRIIQFDGNREEVISELLKSRGVLEGLTPELKRPLKS